MSNSLKTLFAVGAVFTVTGSFLPWYLQGDFIPYRTYGIRVLPTFNDYGGALIALLSIAIIVLVFWPPAFVNMPATWCIALSAFLVLDSAFQIGRILIARFNSGGVLGEPTIQIGLIMVCLGSVLLLISALLYQSRQLH